MAIESTATPSAPYPVRLNIDYPDRQLNRMSSFFRIIVVIPIWIIFALINGGTFSGWNDNGANSFSTLSTAGWGIFAALAFLILFRQKYPRWLFDWNVAIYRLSYRIYSYALLMRDEYPSTDEEQAVHLEIDYPDAKELNRWLPFIKWLLAIPHWIVLIFLTLIGIILVIVAWFAILFIGRYPRGIFNYMLGVNRWSARVVGYALLMVTDKYPPFSLD